MRITSKAMEQIKSNTRLRNLLALAMDCSVYTVDRWIKNNDDSLTKAVALNIIREELGLTDAEILEELESATK